MNASLNLNASKLDLQTLEELRDPNLISRYPPLFQRKQTLLEIPNGDNLLKRYNNSDSSKSTKRSSKLEDVKTRQFPSLTPSSSSINSIDQKKPRRGFTSILKTFSKDNKKKEKQEALKKIISKPIPQSQHGVQKIKEQSQMTESIYTHSMFPSKTKRSFKIKEDSNPAFSEDYTPRSGSKNKKVVTNFGMNFPVSPTDLSAMNNIVIPPVGSSQNISNPEHYSSAIVHPNMTTHYNTMNNINSRNNITFARYDMMNLDNNAAFSPIDIEESAYLSAQINPSEQQSVLNLPTSIFMTTSSDSEDSYYSMVEVERNDPSNKYNQIQRQDCQKPIRNHSRRSHVRSPAYRFSKRSSMRQNHKSSTIHEGFSGERRC
ncbi:uncharacterized protein KGF55_004017 [Candida pseudojiufengensis]|uniref:uncharacterized protein n=1 Tax=Candida pseudojiufengensis TaxID=497109 RepID=UPI002223FCF4|nr:uncharacterized protein KGF55_004017 [Candida pseudojiufengensis]KAI5961394.1 hypothetical protein KGF55_004017 [Candida pseudojiufengensis]